MKELSIVQMEEVNGGGWFSRVKSKFKKAVKVKKISDTSRGDQVTDRESANAACDDVPSWIGKTYCKIGVKIIADKKEKDQAYLDSLGI